MKDPVQASTELAENLALIDRGLADIEAERVYDARDGIRSLPARHGVALDRPSRAQLP